MNSHPNPAPTMISAMTAQTRNQPYKATPSPLRIEATPPSPDQSKALRPNHPPLQSSLAPASLSPTPPVNVTLGHIMRIKRGREERAKFLELEKERRALDEEKLKHETEKRKWEREKRAWEAEREVAEEEKKKMLYQQEVIAARKRRESQLFKVGSMPADLPEIEPQNSRRQGNYSRPAYDPPRRQNLEESSPMISHPPSRHGSSNSLRESSKPQSLHSASPPSPNSSHTVSSIEDTDKIRRRQAPMLLETPPQLPVLMQPYGYPWGMPLMPQMPMPVQMVPQMPYYAMDNMPLLPPTAPFMMQQAGDRRRSTSSSPNRDSTSSGKPVSQSTDRLPPNQGTPSMRRPAGHQRSSSGGSSNQFGNGQWSNQGSGSSSRRSSGIGSDPNQRRDSPRSRPPIPQGHSQGSGSWVVPSPVSQRRQGTVS
ncbi:hypothetical protein BDM02DRAFT_3109595 [Thelephora ganbajun]|uniref:Uncharacterized protein n=1 Tax=Thelephora ganbajun TaxID=370292 RepID=A0ACB6ZQQ3_THEGA|nr:hypothetical protein BDM02DRAFT_3109595 [Thelephora ganbajun]